MNPADTANYAKWLIETRGDRAEVHAAQEQKKYEEAGDKERADSWRKIRTLIREWRGSHVS
ncbi:MAG: hypothetical protein HC850_16470 [Rhodomicrobium sp.]|nr:hypothetical protein [Rhodomicrobium sp.]